MVWNKIQGIGTQGKTHKWSHDLQHQIKKAEAASKKAARETLPTPFLTDVLNLYLVFLLPCINSEAIAPFLMWQK